MKVGGILLLLLAGCTATHYEPRLVARGELTLRYGSFRGLEMWAGGGLVARSPTLYTGLTGFVGCVPQAKKHARRAEGLAWGGTLSALGAVLSGALGSGYFLYDRYHEGLADPPRERLYAIAGIVAVSLFVLRPVLFTPAASANAVDALNFYNDAVGSLGRTCADLHHPP